MKAFFEEYGFVMLSAIVVIALITIAGTLSKTVTTGINNVMTGFESKVISDGKLTVPTTPTDNN